MDLNYSWSDCRLCAIYLRRADSTNEWAIMARFIVAIVFSVLFHLAYFYLLGFIVAVAAILGAVSGFALVYLGVFALDEFI